MASILQILQYFFTLVELVMKNDLFNIIVEILIFFINPFGLINNKLSQWNPVLGTIIIPGREINRKWNILNCLSVKSVRFSSISISFRSIGRLIIHIHVNDLIVEVLPTRNDAERSDLHYSSTSNKRRFLSHLVQSTYLKTLMAFIRPFFGVYFYNSILLIDYPDGVANVELGKLHMTISMQHKLDVCIENQNLTLSIFSVYSPTVDKASAIVLTMEKALLSGSYHTSSKSMHIAVELNQSFGYVDTYSAINVIDFVSFMTKIFRDDLQVLTMKSALRQKSFFDKLQQLSASFIDSNETQQPVVNEMTTISSVQFCNITIEVVTKAVGLMKRLKSFEICKSLSMRSGKLQIRLDKFHESCIALENILQHVDSFSFTVSGVDDCSDVVSGSIDCPFMTLTCKSDHSSGNAVCLVLNGFISQSNVTIDLELLSSCLFVATETMASIKTLKVPLMKPNRPSLSSYNHPRIPVVRGNMSIPLLSISIASEFPVFVDSSVELRFVVTNLTATLSHYDISNETLESNISLSIGEAEVFSPSRCLSIERISFDSSFVSSYQQINKIEASLTIACMNSHIKRDNLISIGYILGHLGGGSPTVSFSRGLISPIKRMSISTTYKKLIVNFNTVKILIDTVDATSSHNDFNVLDVTLRNGILVNLEVFEGETRSTISMREPVIEVISRSKTEYVLLMRGRLNSFVGNQSKPSPIDTYVVCKHIAFDAVTLMDSDCHYGVGIRSTIGDVTISDFEMNLDPLFLRPIIESLTLVSTSASSGRRDFHRYLVVGLSCHDFLYSFIDQVNTLGTYVNFKHVPVHSRQFPTSATTISTRSGCIKFYCNRLDVLGISFDAMTCGVLEFSRLVSQTTVRFESLSIMDMTSPNSIHKVLFCNILDTAIPSNSVELHLSSRLGERSLLEVRGEFIQYVYLQRTTMTLVNYFRDIFIQSLRNYAERIKLLMKNIFDDLESVQDENISIVCKYYIYGMFRMCISVRHFEAHVPMNGAASDSISLVVGHASFYRTCQSFERVSSDYTKGIYLSTRQWISQFSNIRRLKNCFDEEASRVFSHVPWNSQNLDDLIAPIGIPINAQETKFCIDVYNALFASWCSQTSIGNANVNIVLKLRPNILGNPSGLDVECIDELTYAIPSSDYKNLITVDISADEVDWVMTQGQYAAIVYMIQQNFSELIEIVPEIWPAPILKLASLKENVYGADPMFKYLPVFVSVPIRVRKGKIVCIENADDYYRLIQTPLQTIPYISHNVTMKSFNEDVKKPGITDLPNRKVSSMFGNISWQEFNAIPSFSYHHIYRRRLFSRLSKSSLLRYHEYDENTVTPKSSFHPIRGESFMTIIFQGLEVDIYRRHYGGGNGIDVSATDFILFDDHSVDIGSRKETFSDEDVSEYSRHSDINEIPPQGIIFASKSHPSVSGVKKSTVPEFTLDEIYPPTKPSEQAYDQTPHDSESPGSEREADNGDFSMINEDQENDDNNFDDYIETNQFKERFLFDMSDEEEYGDPLAVPHISYHQQGVGNIRRCVVEISDSIAVVHIIPILTAIKYFTEPTALYFERNLGRLRGRNLGPFDFKAGLDVEVHAINTTFCLPNITAIDGANAICVNSNFHYTHSWRGYLQSGPGKMIVSIQLHILSVFISPLHEIRVVGAESVIDPCSVMFKMDFSVLPRKDDIVTNNSSLQKWMKMSTINDRQSRLIHTPIGLRAMMISLYPLDLTDKSHNVFNSNFITSGKVDISEKPEQITEDETEKISIVKVLQLRVSLQDIAFLIVAIQQLTSKINLCKPREPIFNRLSYLCNHFHDLNHLPTLSHFLVHVPLTVAWTECDVDFDVRVSDIQLILRNNTYNLTIGKTDIGEIQLSYNKSGNRLHAAIGLIFSAWSFNEAIDAWEPVFEPTRMSSVTATDSTESTQESKITQLDTIDESTELVTSDATKSNAPKVKVDVYINPVELTMSCSAISNLIRRLRLADVVTTSSAHIPPYLIINELGVSVKCSVGIGNHLITAETVSQGQQFPIEIYQLARARLHTKKVRLRSDFGYSSLSDSIDDDKEHLLSISFEINGEYFESVRPLPIDREGITCFEIRRMKSLQSIASKTSQSTDASLKKSTKKMSTQPTKSEYIPFVLLSMRIKDDGGREIIVRSMLSIKNLTGRVFQLSIRRNDEKADMSIAPNSEWYVPVSLAHPRSSVYIKLNDRSGWFEALQVLHSLMTQGQWGSPTKLRAELVSCPPEHASLEGQKSNWVVLLRPEVREWRASFGTKSTISVKYPSGEPYKPPPIQLAVNGMTRDDAIDSAVMLDDLYNLSRLQAAVSAATMMNTERFHTAQAMCIHMLAPLQLCNIVSIPLLYRVATDEGLILSEGILLPGEIVNIHNLYHIFISSIFISIRIINYQWSKWVKILSTKNPFPSQEKILDIRLSSLNLIYDDNELQLPLLDVYISMREHFLRFSCPILVSNRTGHGLQYCDSSNTDLIVPQKSSASIHELIPISKPSSSLKTNFNKYLKSISERNKKFSKSQFGSIYNPNWQHDDSDDEYYEKLQPSSSELSPFDRMLPVTPTSDPLLGKRDKYMRSPPSRQSSTHAKTFKIRNLIVHLPHDHLKITEIAASCDWTVADVLSRLVGDYMSNSANMNVNSYVCFYWQDGKYGPSKIDVTMMTDDEAVTGAPTQGPQPTPALTRQYSTPVVSLKRSQTSGSEIPEKMKFGMLVDCLPGNQISLNTKIEDLTSVRIRFCHIVEYNIFKQIAEMRIESESKDLSLLNLFGRSKIVYRSLFYPWGSDYIPFHYQRIMGLANFFAVRVESNSEWTDGMDLSRLGFEGANSVIRLNAWTPVDSPNYQGVINRMLEFGVHIEKGRGFFQNITSICLVPRHVLISRLKDPLQIRQHGVDDENTYVRLDENSVSVIHHYFADRPKLLQIRRFFAPGDVEAVANPSNPWCGEVDVSKLGIVYAKLSNPQVIIKIQVEMVAATLVATFSEQNSRWPPYRIDNKSRYPVRIRQNILSKDNRNAFAPADIIADAILAANSVHSGVSSQLIGTPVVKDMENADIIIAWDSVPPNASVSFTWDRPISGGTQLQIEFPQGTSVRRIDTDLNEVAKAKTIKLLRNDIPLSSPSAEGLIYHRENNDQWIQVYCILKGDTIYMFRDETRDEIIDVYNFVKPSKDIKSHAQRNSQFVRISKCIEKSAWGDKFMTSMGLGSGVLSATPLSSSLLFNLASTLNPSAISVDNNTKVTIDINQARILILILSELLNFFDAIEVGNENGPASDDSNAVRDKSINSSSVPIRDTSHEGPKLNAKTTLRKLFQSGFAVDQLLEIAVTKSCTGSDLLMALLATGYADSERAAIQLIEILLLDGVIVKQMLVQSSSNDNMSSSLSPGQEVPSDSNLPSSANAIEKVEVVHDYFISETNNDPSTLPSTSPSKRSDITLSLLTDSERRDDPLFRVSEDIIDESPDLPLSPTFMESVMAGATEINAQLKPLVVDFSQNPLTSSAWSTSTPLSLMKSDSSSDRLNEASSADNSGMFRMPLYNSASYLPNRNRFINPQATRVTKQYVDDVKQSKYSFRNIPLDLEFISVVDSTSNDRSNSDDPDNYSFTITWSNRRHHFKCSSSTEYLGWTYACRLNNELAWVDMMKSNDYVIKPPKSIDMMYSKVIMRVRADGPTKVLEVMDIDHHDDKTSLRNELSSEASDTQSRHITDALSVSIAVESLAISVVDSEPVEILHLSLEDIEMSIERTRYLVRMAATVQAIHVSNQLLNPLYPVALYPRFHRDPRTASGNDGIQRLLLPGLHQRDRQLPSMHLYFQEKYHGKRNQIVNILGTGPSKEPQLQKTVENNEPSRSATDEETNLLYFETFTVWLAPMQLDVDEELLIRLVRMFQSIRQVFKRSDIGLPSTIREEILSNQHLGTKTWGLLDPKETALSYQQFMCSDQLIYSSYDIYAPPSRGIYFSLLQLHPLDVLVCIRPSPSFHLTTTETALISLIAQVDSSRICLNALIAEHAYGSTSMILDVLTKHYRAALWKQVQKFIGSADIVEGSVGLVANLGTGVYDLFYEPIDGLMADNGSFLDGLSKGGKSLATRTIGGTSAFTSKITGGIGRGVSLLTLDTDFQRTRSSRRLNKASSVSEGLYVGTKELGKNIVDGVTGIVKAPYRGWEQGGGVGFGVGIAKGLLGVALKPAVGVLDLASRATEGLRNTAFSEMNEYDADGRYIVRKRLPRPFGRNYMILEYNTERAAAQYIADHLTGFKRTPRFHIVHHQHIIRKIQDRYRSDEVTIEHSSDLNLSESNHQESDHSSRSTSPNPLGQSSNYHVKNSINPMFRNISPDHEAWGMPLNNSYIASVSPDRIALFQINSHRKNTTLDLSVVWSCPAICILELFSDNRGDLILNLSQNVSMIGAWNHPGPIILNKHAQDYVIFQLIMEQTLGLKHGRAQALYPKGGLIDTDVWKRYSTGLKSLVYSPTKQTFQLVGHVLYEYTVNETFKSSTNPSDHSNPDTDESANKQQQFKYPSDHYFGGMINDMFGMRAPTGLSPHYIGSNNTNDDTDTSIVPDGYLSFIYPLVDVAIMGPFIEDNNRYSISISNSDPQQRMKVLRRESEDSLLSEYNKTILTMIFSSRERAFTWKKYLEKHMIISSRDTIDSVSAGNKLLRSLNRVLAPSISGGTKDMDEPPTNSILGLLVIPSSGLNSKDTEVLKIEIAKTLSNVRKY